MALDFPASPTVGQTYTFNGRTWKWNGTGWAQVRQASVTMSATAPTSPSVGDEWFDTSTGIWYRYIDDGTHQQWVETGPTGQVGGQVAFDPSGRLTLTSGTPILTANTTGAGTVYFTPYLGNQIPLYNGSTWNQYNFSELSNVLANSATGNAGPAAVTTNKNYDLFVWISGGTLYLTRGGAWNSDTARSATTENDLSLVGGLYTNLNAITNGPAATCGLYVGTIRTNGTSTVDWKYNANSTGANTLATIGLWNNYNRKQVWACSHDTTNGYTYASSTVRERNANTGNARVQFISGLAEDIIQAQCHHVMASSATPARAYSGVKLDANNAADMLDFAPATTTFNPACDTAGFANWVPQLGFHYVCYVEKAESANTVTFYQDVVDYVILWY